MRSQNQQSIKVLLNNLSFHLAIYKYKFFIQQMINLIRFKFILFTFYYILLTSSIY